jgi:integrase
MRKLLQKKVLDPKTGKRRSLYAASPLELERKVALFLGHTGSNRLDEFQAYVFAPTARMKSDSWNRQIDWVWNDYIGPEFGTRQIPSITRREVQEFFNSLSALPNLGPASLSAIKVVFSAMMNLAVDHEIIQANPVSRAKIPPAPPSRITVLAPHELKALYWASEGSLRRFVVLAGFLGLRIGEAHGMTRAKLRNHSLIVDQQKCRDGVVRDRLKTPQSHRTIPLPLEIEKALEGSGVSLVEGGLAWTPKLLKRLCQKAGVPEVSPHELRHTFISLMENELAVPPAIVARLAGKRNMGVTAGYSHVSDAQARMWLSKLWETVMESEGKVSFVGQEATS